jgi:hypothetical protein
VITGPLRKRSSQGIIRRANTLCGVFILLESSWNRVRSRYAKYTRTWMFQILWQSLSCNLSMRRTQEPWVLDIFSIDSSASGRQLEICPRGNQRDDFISLYPRFVMCSLNIQEKAACMVILKVVPSWSSCEDTREH